MVWHTIKAVVSCEILAKLAAFSKIKAETHVAIGKM
jgi:hypothetical protein